MKIVGRMVCAASVCFAVSRSECSGQFASVSGFRANLYSTCCASVHPEQQCDLAQEQHSDFLNLVEGVSAAASVGGLSSGANGDVNLTLSTTRIRAIGSAQAIASGAPFPPPPDQGAGAFGQVIVEVDFSLARESMLTFVRGRLELPGYLTGADVCRFEITSEVPPYWYAAVDGTEYPKFDGESIKLPAGSYRMQLLASVSASLSDALNPMTTRMSRFDLDIAANPLVPPCDGDADGSGEVNFADITNVLTNFGADYSPGTGPGDADRNGVVNFSDITNVLTFFGAACR